ncbi:MAG: hypothetical protein JXR49_13915 [Acidobacteria bacterium]|nr:hypothetical protein [Acidobacteriota bacterium]
MTTLEKPDQPTEDKPQASTEPVTSVKNPIPQKAPALKTLSQKPSALFALLRALLIFLSIVVAAGFLWILLSQTTTDRFLEDLRSQSSASGEEMVAFLYLGHEIQNNEFHIRGVVRNITTEPIEQLDAAVRLYSYNRELLETAIVRMNKETIDPDEIAQFELVYPNYQSEFSSYSVEFKLRRGAFVPYKDMRGLQEQSDRNSGEESD